MKTVEVVAAVIQHEGRILATQRGYGEFEGGWEFPGGKIEPGESPEQALVREIHEELEAIISVDEFLVTVEHDYSSFHLCMHCYACHVTEGHLRLLEHSAAKWLTIESIDSVEWLAADIEVVEAIKNSPYFN